MTARGAPGPIPLLTRFPALEAVPRVPLGTFPTPVQRLATLDSPAPLWIKRDDLSAEEFGGNKVRALEYLLAGVGPGDTVLTVGGEGSTHVLTTAAHARRLGAAVVAVRWRHEMNPIADQVEARARTLLSEVTTSGGAVSGMLRALGERIAGKVHWVPAGGTSPLGMLGHVNAALELVAQMAAGAAPRIGRVVAPLGSGGTVAGLALGFAIAETPVTVVGARVVSRVVANEPRVRLLAHRAARMIERLTGERLPRPARLEILHGAYGGAYGRATAAGEAARAALHDTAGIRLDATYSAKALAAALGGEVGAPVLFWLTFDARWLADGD
ncbi:MAG TPA: pyridoxal-phosphate dependent enzyme [Gemmatimonadaceae bacterium]|nr:pyridoxal-phosphate dependent enzyme [Gemmatimonadaceae bacterium]